MRSRGLGHSIHPPGPCPARPYLPGSPCACTRRLQAHRARRQRRRRRREPERKERQRVSDRGGEGGGSPGAGARARTLTRLGVKFPHAGGAAGGASLSHAPGQRIAAPRLALVLRERFPSRAEPEAAPGRVLAAVAAARLTPGRAEPPSPPPRPAPPRAPIGRARRIKGEAGRRGAGLGAGPAAWGRGAARRCRAETAPPSELRFSSRPPGLGSGRGDPGLGSRGGGSGR